MIFQDYIFISSSAKPTEKHSINLIETKANNFRNFLGSVR